MNESFLGDYLDRMRQAAADACGFIEGLSKEQFLGDKHTQRAVVMSLVILGEAATKVMDRFVNFVASTRSYPGAACEDCENRIAHGYFDLDLDVVWETVNTALPEGLRQLSDLRSNPFDDDGRHKSEA